MSTSGGLFELHKPLWNQNYGNVLDPCAGGWDNHGSYMDQQLAEPTVHKIQDSFCVVVTSSDNVCLAVGRAFRPGACGAVWERTTTSAYCVGITGFCCPCHPLTSDPFFTIRTSRPVNGQLPPRLAQSIFTAGNHFNLGIVPFLL